MKIPILKLGIVLGCIVVLGCMRKTSSEKESSLASKDGPSAPMVSSFIFAERAGSDTLILLDVIKAEGFLRASPAKREDDVPPNSYRLSFMNIIGDTLAQSVNPSVLKERLESPQPDGSIHSVEVELLEGVFVVRTTTNQIHAILVERSSEEGAIKKLQRIVLSHRDQTN